MTLFSLFIWAFAIPNEMQLEFDLRSRSVVEFLPADIHDIAMGDGKIFISVLLKSSIFVFNKKGEPLKPLGEKGLGPEEIMHPQSLAFRNGRLFILDRGTGFLVIMNPNSGKILEKIRMAHGNNLLVGPESLYVAFNLPKTNNTSSGMVGKASLENPGHLHVLFYEEPCCLQIQGTKTSGLLLDSDHNLWIAYTGEYRIEKFNNNGDMLKRIDLEPHDFEIPRPLEPKYKYNRKARSRHYRSFDKIGGIFQLNQSIVVHRYKHMGDARLDTYSLAGEPINIGISISNLVPFSSNSERLLAYREAENEEDLLLEIVEIKLSNK